MDKEVSGRRERVQQGFPKPRAGAAANPSPVTPPQFGDELHPELMFSLNHFSVPNGPVTEVAGRGQVPDSEAVGTAPTSHERLVTSILLARGLEILERQVQEKPESFQSLSHAGHEIEYVLLDQSGAPAPLAPDILRQNPDFQGELSDYNLETDSRPLPVGADFLVGLLEQLKESHHRAEQAASSFGARAVLAGILPGYRLEHFPKERFVSNRYRNLDAGIKALTGRQSFDVHLEGPEGVAFCAPYILVEAINTSFQLHLSVAPDRFVRTYNVVQAISGIALAPAVNSPVVFGRECWAESRIPIWEQATRPEQVPFGDSWITSPLDPLFDLRRYDAILIDPEVIEAAPTAAEEHLDDLAKRTLALQNGIVWRWNRLCFGDDHLRIESRFLPAGPTPIDMVANAAFFYGLILGVSLELSNRFGASSIEDLLPFEVAKRNFRQAAQFGPAAQLQWIDSSGKLERYPARTLCLMLLPLADRGLESVGVPAKQREEFLGIVRDRLIHKQSGAEWIVARLRQLRGERHPSPEQALALELHKYQSEKNSAFRGSARPVHLWGRNSGD